MAPRFPFSTLWVGAILIAPVSYAATGVAPPAMYPANVWQGKTEAVIRILNRLDAHLEILKIPVGETASYRTLSIKVDSCVERPATLPSAAAVMLHLHDEDMSRPSFDGWMLENEPSLATYMSPLYDVRVVSCSGLNTAPDPGPIPVSKTPSINKKSIANEEGGDNNNQASSRSSGGGPVPLAPESHSPIPLAPPSGATSLAPPMPAAPSTQPLDPPVADPGLE